MIRIIFPNIIIIMLSAQLVGSNKYQFLSHWFDSTKVQILRSPKISLTLYSFGHPVWPAVKLDSPD